MIPPILCPPGVALTRSRLRIHVTWRRAWLRSELQWVSLAPLRWPEPAPAVRACRSCGCTEAADCPGGCWWVGPDLCSACAKDLGSGVRCP